MKDDNKTYTLITGATTGIGYQLTRLFAEDQNNIILVARDKEKLETVSNQFKNRNIDIIYKSIDLSDMNECDRLIEFIEQNNIKVDTLVNNAGIGSFGDFKDLKFESEEKLIDINIKALTKLTNYFLPQIINNKRGGILNVASTAAFCAGPRMATYYASKSYVLNLTEAIYEEVRKYGIKVSCLCPGPVRTNFQNRAGIKKTENAKRYLMDAEVVAKIGYKGFKQGKVVIIPGYKNKFLVVINKLIPRVISRKVVLKTNKS